MGGSDHAPVIDGIERLELIGEGGFAVVYKGFQPAFRRHVAVKVLQRTGLGAEDRQRFDRECQAMGALSDHPGIVTLYDAGFTEDQRPYLVMAYVEHGTLGDRILTDGPLSWRDATDLGVRLCGALETAHRASVLHRDIKPANILSSQYGEQLSDFGIARIQGGHETRSGVITASVAHAAPEILDGRPPTPQADIYSLASTLYEALTGRPAFAGESDEGLLPLIRRVVSEQPPDLRERGVPGVVAALIETAMAKDPAERYASAEAFGLALRGAQAVMGIHVADLVIVGPPPGGIDVPEAPEADDASVAGAAAADAVAAGDAGGAGDAPPEQPPPPPPPVDRDDRDDGDDGDADSDGGDDEGAGDDDGADDVPTAGADAGGAVAAGGAGATIVVEPPRTGGVDGGPPDAATIGGGGGGATPDAELAPDEPPRRRNKAVLAGGALLGAAALVGGLIVVTRDDPPAADPPPATPQPATTLAPTTDPVESSTSAVPDTSPPPSSTEPPETTTTSIDVVVIEGPAIGYVTPRVGPGHPVVVGLDETAAELDIELARGDPGGDPAEELAALVAGGQQTIITLADDATGDVVAAVTGAADEHPDVGFIVIDAVVDAPNVASTGFAEHEGSFMVGVIAALTSTTGRVGFIGGIDNLRIRRYESGFVAGARHISPTIQIDVRYFPGEGQRVGDADLERETAISMYDVGADVIFHAGTVGTGLFQAAAMQPDRWAIGADTDRAASAPPDLAPSILTSMVKSYREVASDMLRAEVSGELNAGIVVRDLADGGVGWSTTGGHVDPIADQVEAIATEVIDGSLEVPSLIELRALAPLSGDCPTEGCFARILDAVVDGSELALTIEANFFMAETANHLHWFWSPRWEPNQVGVDSADRFGVEVGEWDIDARYPVYVTEGTVSLSRRAVEDTRLCVTPADAGHNVIDPSLFDCLIFSG